MMKYSLVTTSNVRNYVTCVLLHHSPQYAKAAADVLANQWNHKEAEISRNIKSMTEESRDNLPCHLALLLKLPCKENHLSPGNTGEGDALEVVGHVKLVRASGRGDGSSCISYSLVVAEAFRRLGLGRILTEEGENYVRSLNISYMYLSTNDKVTFYEHLGYKQCESISSLGDNAKRLNSMQVSALENLFAKRSNVDNSTGNTWLRKRLIQEYPLIDVMDIRKRTEGISSSLQSLIEDSEGKVSTCHHYIGFFNHVRWQQQTGPSCGISALNMVQGFLSDKEKGQSVEVHNVDAEKGGSINSHCNCTGEMKHIDMNTTFNSTLDFAINLGVTNDGEMFCAYNLAYIAEVYNKVKLNVKEIKDLNDNMDGLNNSTDVSEVNASMPPDILKSICKGYPVLIPYDRSNSFTPGQSDGRFAHWAVIVGIILPSTYKDFIPHVDMKSYKEEVSIGIDIEMYDISVGLDIDEGNQLGDNLRDDLILICMHGMSENCFLSSYNNLMASNRQLKNSKSKFYLASEGLLHLRNKILFLSQ